MGKGWTILEELRRGLSAPDRSGAASHAFLASNSQLKELLALRLSPTLEAAGYRYDGEYQWIGPWERRCRRVIRVRLLKGAGGEFAFGWCFDFIPVLQNDCRGYRCQRTDRSAGLQLFVWTRDLITPAEVESRRYQFSLFGEALADVERRIVQVFGRSKPLGDAWFRASQGPARLLETAAEQGCQALRHWPDPEYIRAFLLSASGRQPEGARVLDAWFDQREPQIPEDLREKLRGKLRSCGGLLADGEQDKCR